MKLDKINYNGGEIWVDKEATLNVGDYYINNEDKVLLYQGCLPTYHYLNSVKVVAQSITNPSYIDGVPFVEVGEDDEQIISKFSFQEIAYNNDLTVRELNAYKNGVVFGYKAAQAKQFTEEDMRKAFQAGQELGKNDALFHATDRISRHEYESTPDEDDFINSLKPKVSSIEIEMEVKLPNGLIPAIMTGNDVSSFLVPITYQKDGKTFLKVK